MYRSNIHDCTYGIMELYSSDRVEFYQCDFFSNREYELITNRGSENVVFEGCRFFGNWADAPRTSVFETDEYKAIVGKADNYLESLNVLYQNATIQFTPQPYFTECTTEWAATLQDLVTSDKYASTEEAMQELTAELNDLANGY